MNFVVVSCVSIKMVVCIMIHNCSYCVLIRAVVAVWLNTSHNLFTLYEKKINTLYSTPDKFIYNQYCTGQNFNGQVLTISGQYPLL